MEFGNFAARPDRSLGWRHAHAENERCVLAFAVYLAAPEQKGLRLRVRRVLRGKKLACHCCGSGLPCHAEVLAAWANSCVPVSVLASAARA